MQYCIPTDASALLRPYEPNAILFEDADDSHPGWAFRAFEEANRSPVPPELGDGDPGTPLLRWPDADVPPVVLLAAMLEPPTHRGSSCDRCTRSHCRGARVHRLWVPCGASAVEVQVCGLCHNVLNDVYRSGDGSAPLLVWRR